MKITKEQYDEAKRIVSLYESELKAIEEKRIKQLKKDQLTKEQECEKTGGHEYRPNVHKWGSTTRVKCIDCGKTID